MRKGRPYVIGGMCMDCAISLVAVGLTGTQFCGYWQTLTWRIQIRSPMTCSQGATHCLPKMGRGPFSLVCNMAHLQL